MRKRTILLTLIKENIENIINSFLYWLHVFMYRPVYIYTWTSTSMQACMHASIAQWTTTTTIKTTTDTMAFSCHSAKQIQENVMNCEAPTPNASSFQSRVSSVGIMKGHRVIQALDQEPSSSNIVKNNMNNPQLCKLEIQSSRYKDQNVNKLLFFYFSCWFFYQLICNWPYYLLHLNFTLVTCVGWKKTPFLRLFF